MQKSYLILVLFLFNQLSACLYSSVTVTCDCFCHDTTEFIKRQSAKKEQSPFERQQVKLNNYALWGRQGTEKGAS